MMRAFCRSSVALQRLQYAAAAPPPPPRGSGGGIVVGVGASGRRVARSSSSSSSAHAPGAVLLPPPVPLPPPALIMRRGVSSSSSSSSSRCRVIAAAAGEDGAASAPAAAAAAAAPPSTSTSSTSSSSSSTSSSSSSSSGGGGGGDGESQHRTAAKFCRQCGAGMALIQPEGDREWRWVCGACGYVDYLNPKMVVGALVEHEGKVLLCKRAIEPCRGLWTLPAGFMELNESTAQGAARETLEEANAAIEVLAPYAHLDIPVIGQTYIIFRARLAPPYTFSAGPESLEVALFSPAELPFDQLAFSSVSIVLRGFLDDLASGGYKFRHGVVHKTAGTGPNQRGAFELGDLFELPLAAGPPPGVGK